MSHMRYLSKHKARNPVFKIDFNIRHIHITNTMEESDINALINNKFDDDIDTLPADELSEEYLNSFKLIMFSDGSCVNIGKDNSKGGLGIYIYCNNPKSPYYSHNDTKIIKKIDKDVIMYNQNTFDIVYYNQMHATDVASKCKNDSCASYGTYGINDKNYCKKHKVAKMELNNHYEVYKPTNIRAEGFAILYVLIYIKTLAVDGIVNKKIISRSIKIDSIDNFSKSLKYMDFRKTSDNKFLIVTDSDFWIKTITMYMNSWIRKNIVHTYKNVDIVLLINHYVNILIDNKIQIVFKHIRGHCKDKDKKLIKKEDLNLYHRGNEMADKLAGISHDSTSLALRIH